MTLVTEIPEATPLLAPFSPAQLGFEVGTENGGYFWRFAGDLKWHGPFVTALAAVQDWNDY